MADNTHPVDPATVAKLDQDIAHVNNMLTVLTETYRATCTQYGHEETLTGISALLDGQAEDKKALSDHLAVAIHRITELENIINKLTDEIAQILAENR